MISINVIWIAVTKPLYCGKAIRISYPEWVISNFN